MTRPAATTGSEDRQADSSRVVAIDGPSGTGKSTVSRRLASELGYGYLDTGAMYRAATWACLQAGVNLDDPARVAEVVGRMRLSISTDPQAFAVNVDDTDVAAAIRTDTVSRSVSAVSSLPRVRALLIAQQRSLIDGRAVVAEGRDITTVVAPTAPVRVLLTADTQARAQRRAAESDSDARATADALHRRDSADSATTSFRRAADGVITLDTTNLGIDEVVAELRSFCRDAGLLTSGADR